MATEEQLSGWTGPSSATEQDKQDRTERMIRQAVDEHAAFDTVNLTIFAKGSYANNTNVRVESDVDVAVECCECIYWEEAEPGSYRDYIPYDGPWAPDKLRSELVSALKSKFPGQVDSRGKVAIEVHSSSARIDADVVPCFTYRRYFSSGNYWEGTKIFRTDGRSIVNYPKQQLKNGRAKNNRTNYAYKKTVRILKRVQYSMVDDGTFRELPSYFIECLVYNCPDDTFDHKSWTTIVRQALFHIWDSLKGDEPSESSSRWVEANECFYLFHNGQDWTRADGRDFAKAAWNYLQLGND
jgi:hypothetical protein